MSCAPSANNSLSPCCWMNCCAAGQRLWIFSCSCRKLRGRQHDAADVAHADVSIASLSVNVGRTLSLAMKRPCTWQARMRSSSITGVLVASESSKPSSTALHDRGQIGTRIEQPHLRFHRERVGALLHDAGAFAVVLADDDQRAARDAARSEIGQRVGGDVGSDRGFERDGAAQRVVDGGGQRGGGGRLGRAVFEMNAQLFEDVVGVGEHVHQVRNRRALIAGHVRNAGLQQRLGDRENAFAAKFLAVAEVAASGLPS